MGMIQGILSGGGAIGTIGRAAQGISEVFIPNATDGQRLTFEAQKAALDQLGAEFALERRCRFDRFVDALNRLPRPTLALGTLALFVYAMAAPAGFATRMQGLAFVPEPLWWLLGAIVGFYFGARELHYVRRPAAEAPVRAVPRISGWHAPETAPETGIDAANADNAPEEVGANAGDADSAANPALADWRSRQS